MDESLFQRIPNGDVSAALLILAVGAAAVGLAIGVVQGLRRRQPLRWGLLGALAGATGLAILGGWHLVVARTCFHDRLYPGSGPLHVPSPPAQDDEARQRASYSPDDPLFRAGGPGSAPDGPGGRLWLPAGRLDSVGNLVLLGVLFALGGLVTGVVWGRVLRGLRRAGEEGT